MKYFDFLYFRGRLGLAEILKAFNLSYKKIGVLGFTCVAVPQAILSIKAKPIWIDTQKNWLGIDFNDLRKKINFLDALIVQHTFGFKENLSLINKINKNKIPIIEDCCHSFYNNNFQFSDAKFYSFERGKLINLMLGGAVKIKDKKIKSKIQNSYKNNFKNIPLLVFVKLFIMAIGFLLYRPQFKKVVKKLYYYLCDKKIFISNYNENYLDNVFKENYKISLVQKYLLTKKMKNMYKIKQVIFQNIKNINKLFNKNIKGDIIKYPFIIKDKKKTLKILKNLKIEYSDIYNSPAHPLRIKDIKKIKRLNYKTCHNAEKLSEQIISIDISKKIISSTDLKFFKNNLCLVK